MKVKTGVIAAAGSGTRMLPVTLGYPKELLPIINKPAIHLIVEEFIDSGLDKIIIVAGDNSEPLRRFYAAESLPLPGKHKPVDEFVNRCSRVEIIIEQQSGPYGNGTPLIVARTHIPDGEGFIYAYGDDLIKSVQPFTRRLIEAHERTGALVIATQRIPLEDVVRYGVVELKAGENPDAELRDLVEKPTPEEAPSDLAVFGRFLLSTEICRILPEIPRGKGNELWLTDALREFIRRGGRIVSESISDGMWLTIGDPVNYLKTVIEYALEDGELRAALEPRIRELMCC
ncbi:MAG TPA: sugar phosphate nucleotidyltransferase [Blastocatellia bacterium]|nr:sugar phosphate nucleotidyltransferase [Blastocatellia bacterium]